MPKIKKKTWKWVILTIVFLLFTFSIFFLRTYIINNRIVLATGNPKDSLLLSDGKMMMRRFFSKNEKLGNDSDRIGWISDIHADRFKRRTVDSGTIYPRQYVDYLRKVFDVMRDKGIDTVVATGDNTNSGDDNYAEELSKIAQEKRMRVIWVRGNHDNDRVMNILSGQDKKYYFFDYGNTRIVALDNVESDGSYHGNIDEAQLDWLGKVLKTEKQVIISMHIPIFDGGDALNSNHLLKGGDFMQVGNVLDEYIKLENILHENKNVKMVISGHWHVPWRKQVDGVDYYGQAALTRENYSGAYGIIDLKENTIDYLFAK